jgi:hypothetical protein
MGASLLASCYSLKKGPATWPTLMDRLTTVDREMTVPLVEIPSGAGMASYMAVKVKGEKREYLLQVDTGSSLTLFRESVAKELHLKRVGRGEIVGLPDGDNHAEVCLTSSLSLGEFRLKEETAASMPDVRFAGFEKISGIRVDGILGASLLHRGEVEINGASRTLTLRPFSQSAIQNSQKTVELLPIHDLNGFAVPLDVNFDKPGRFLLDTGSNAELIFDGAGRFGRKIKSTHSIGSEECCTIRGSYPVPAYRLPFPMILGGRRFDPGSRVYVEDRQDHRLEGSIGTPIFWSSRKVILNVKQERASFEPKGG